MAIEYFNEAQVLELIQKLTQVTFDERLQWEPVENLPYTFVASLGRTSFEIESKDHDDLAPHLLRIFMIDGSDVRELQEINSAYLAPVAAGQLQALYHRAQRKALNIDHVASNILEELDQLRDEPPF